ncbi:Nuclear factor 1 A-type isoform 2 [Cinnamomum micranthum f. kanehirae]|uniref:Nuclear factor 1 A-type isoform 2 n=1 Tax=Cinnamomum micranthum f. kanehirae TaxID=337451 RepID=A0A3S3MVZ6_9MAGN|nr:Nuclear factor 1 A-type isoform 2 [Cinnamomum micranthum f. kanehirae]
MDPQTFVRLSIGSLGLRIPLAASKAVRAEIHSASSPCLCEIRLRGFPVQIASVPLISSPGATLDPHSIASSFYLEESDVKALLAPGCFQAPHTYLEITVFTGRQGSHCGVSSRKQQIGTFRVRVGPEWGEGKSLLLHNGWIGIGKNKQEDGKPGPELHLKVKLDPDPRYVFQFEDETALSPQIVQLQGAIKQPIFSCKFSRDRRGSQLDSMSNNYQSSFANGNDHECERKGWRVMIHDLSGSAVAVAFMATPFVPSTGCDRVARSNPGGWLILRPDSSGSTGWQPWGRLEAWRECGGSRDHVCCRLHLLTESQEGQGLVVSEMLISADKGGEFSIDMDRQQAPTAGGMMPVPSPQSSGDFTSLAPPIAGGFVMNCKVNGEGKSSKPLVQLATRHVTCVEDAAVFMALAAAVDLSMVACRPFRRKAKKGGHHHSL